MTSRDFCYWLQGYFEIRNAGFGPDAGSNELPKPLTLAQEEIILRHLAMVFKHEIDPSMGDQLHQQNLNHLHSPFNSDSDLVRC